MSIIQSAAIVSSSNRLLTGVQSTAGCYSAQGGFSVDSINGITTLTLGVWPSDPPNCQTCNWQWLQNGGRGANGLSNDSTSNIYRAANSIKPYWTNVWTVNLDALAVGSSTQTRAPNWPYTQVSYTYIINKLSPSCISIVPYTDAWYTGDTGTSISVANWWSNVVALGGGDNSGSYSPTYLGQIILSWAITPPGLTVYSSGSGTFTVPSGVTLLNVSMTAAGGNGGAGADYGSGGGGSGGYYYGYGYSVTPGQTISYSVGGVGANTTFGVLTCTPGGTAPSGSSTYTAGTAGSPNGQAGQAGNQTSNNTLTGSAVAGKGASSPFGVGGAGGVGGGPGVTGGNGGAATGYGAGGGGGGNNATAGAAAPGRIWISY